MMKGDDHDLLAQAEIIAKRMASMQIAPLVIGAVALAAHHYVRTTKDIDLGVSIDLQKMRQLDAELSSLGYRTKLHLPDGDDPLGGVLDIIGEFGLIQIVNFGGRFPAVIDDALAAPPHWIGNEESSLRVISLPNLVALKLYAGGLKSKADIVELLKRNPDADFDQIAQVCHTYRLKGFAEILAELDPPPQST